MQNNILKPNELRIGNLVHQHTYRNGICAVNRKICAINDEGFVSIVVSETNQRLSKHKIEWFSGIRLRPEWLTNFGFVNKGNLVYNSFDTWAALVDLNHSDFIFDLTTSPDRSNYFYKSSNPIKYVHQLQNIYFALTGQELELII